MPKAHFKIVKATVDEWIPQIDKAIEDKEKQQREYETLKQILVPKLKEAMDKGVSARELAKITGICNVTICRWVNAIKAEKSDA